MGHDKDISEDAYCLSDMSCISIRSVSWTLQFKLFGPKQTSMDLPDTFGCNVELMLSVTLDSHNLNPFTTVAVGNPMYGLGWLPQFLYDKTTDV